MAAVRNVYTKKWDKRSCAQKLCRVELRSASDMEVVIGAVLRDAREQVELEAGTAPYMSLCIDLFHVRRPRPNGIY